MQLISILILSYNTKDLLRICLQSIYKNLSNVSFEVIVLDNASKDGSPEMIRKEFPDTKIIVSEKNLGFAKGMNEAVKKAKGDYLLFLNSDAILTDSTVFNMLTFSESSADVAIVGGQLLDADGTLQRSFGNFYTLPMAFILLFAGEKVELALQNTKTIKQVDWVNGGFMLIKKDIFERVKGFDERYFMYVEDMDLCYRVKQAGYKTFFYPTATAIHTNQGSSNRSFAIQHIHKGLLLFYKNHKSYLEYLILKALILLKETILTFIGMITGNSYLKTTYKHT